jgi:SulP family sulfate permease
MLPLTGLRTHWRADLLAAGIVAILLIPQSLAYALLAGVPAQVGLYASLLPLLAYAAFGSSPVLGLGPVAVLALMIAQGLAALPADVPITQGALVMAAEVGLCLAAAAALRLDALASLLSVPALRGFESGAMLMIAASQLPVLLGNPAQGFTLLELWAGGGLHLGSAAALAWGLASLCLLLARRIPHDGWARVAPLGLLLGAMALSWGTSWSAGVAQVGALPSLSLPLGWPPLRVDVWLVLAPHAGLVALMGFVSSLVVAESLAQRRGERLQPAAELRGLAAANLVAALSGGMPVAGSFSRSILLHEAGSRTCWTLVFLAGFMGLAMLLLAGPLAYLPKPVLAATIVLAVLSGVSWQPYRDAWRYARAEGALMLLVSAAVLLWNLGAGLALGVLGSIALLLQHTARPHVARIGRIPGTEHYRNVERFSVEIRPEVLGLRIDESLVFTNARGLTDVVLAHIQAQGAAPLQRVLVQMAPVNAIDFSGLSALRDLHASLRDRGLRLDLSEVKGPVLDRLRAGGWEDWFDGRVYLSHHAGCTDGEQVLRPSLADRDAPGQL